MKKVSFKVDLEVQDDKVPVYELKFYVEQALHHWRDHALKHNIPPTLHDNFSYKVVLNGKTEYKKG